MPEDVERAARTHSVWSGTVSFGLVSIPVRLFPAQRPGRVSLRMLDDDGTPLERRYYDPETDEEVDRTEIVRGYELDDGSWVTVELVGAPGTISMSGRSSWTSAAGAP